MTPFLSAHLDLNLLLAVFNNNCQYWRIVIFSLCLLGEKYSDFVVPPKIRREKNEFPHRLIVSALLLLSKMRRTNIYWMFTYNACQYTLCNKSDGKKWEHAFWHTLNITLKTTFVFKICRLTFSILFNYSQAFSTMGRKICINEGWACFCYFFLFSRSLHLS